MDYALRRAGERNALAAALRRLGGRLPTCVSYGSVQYVSRIIPISTTATAPAAVAANAERPMLTRKSCVRIFARLCVQGLHRLSRYLANSVLDCYGFLEPYGGEEG
jgi:hypothetical protein